MRFTILTILFWVLSLQAYATDCKKELEKHLDTDLSLSYKQFDQTENSGMRVLSGKGCYKETAVLIKAYISHNNAKESSLRWHLAQQYAMADDRESAIEAAKTTLKPDEADRESPFRWNDYVLATIAFLEKDKAGLERHTMAVKKDGEKHFGNKLNAKLLDALIRHFETDYLYATSRVD